MRILWIPHTSWHIPQRAHVFCRALAEEHEVHVTDWVADFYQLRDYFSSSYLRNFFYRYHRDDRIHVHGIPRVSPAIYSRLLRWFNVRVLSFFVAHIIARYAIDVVVGSFLVPPPTAPRLVFDLFDENVAYWRSFGPVPEYADEIAQNELAYLQKADAVVAVSSVLVDKARALRAQGSIYHIPNGVDLGLFQQADGSKFRKRLGLHRQLVGMVGNHDKPQELTKVLDAVKAFADNNVMFLIAGRGTAVPALEKQVQREGLSNIIFQGYVPPHEVADVISALNVGLCPYIKTVGADSSSPMRLLMYAAAGLPTVCTDLEEVRRANFSNVILVDDDPKSLADGIKYALQLPRIRPPQIDNYDIKRLVKQYEAVLNGRLLVNQEPMRIKNTI